MRQWVKLSFVQSPIPASWLQDPCCFLSLLQLVGISHRQFWSRCHHLGAGYKMIIQLHTQKIQFVLLAPDRCFTRLKIIIFKLIIEISSLGNCCEIPLSWMPLNLVGVVCQHCFMWLLGAVRPQAMTWTNVDQNCRCRMTSLGHNMLWYAAYHFLICLLHCGLVMPYDLIDLGQHWLR